MPRECHQYTQMGELQELTILNSTCLKGLKDIFFVPIWWQLTQKGRFLNKDPWTVGPHFQSFLGFYLSKMSSKSKVGWGLKFSFCLIPVISCHAHISSWVESATAQLCPRNFKNNSLVQLPQRSEWYGDSAPLASNWKRKLYREQYLSKWLCNGSYLPAVVKFIRNSSQRFLTLNILILKPLQTWGFYFSILLMFRWHKL